MRPAEQPEPPPRAALTRLELVLSVVAASEVNFGDAITGAAVAQNLEVSNGAVAPADAHPDVLVVKEMTYEVCPACGQRCGVAAVRKVRDVSGGTM